MTQQNAYTRQWIAGGKILCFRFNSLGGATAEEWYTEMMVNYDTWRQNNERVLVLLDLRNSGNLLSAEGMARARDLAAKFGDLEGRIALLIDTNESFKNLAMFLERGITAQARERKLFEEEQAAIDWLLGE
ncbi:MAG: hypothetical protein J0M07_00855 [Anaerolineae bacterium]|jgi:hypothetical protein|uniref:hypothetical protein n=1 Tax=Candidatus Flexifilum breve TaxID=3140694 RepID=UPI001ACA712D|nr:hypothetical protein [Chloroflexota bacterium]MBK9750932.1 hypothetical protein [Chloroflexota bacterium]MBN8633841.1 hypothetical protein [Anaerolineae bacterium]